MGSDELRVFAVGPDNVVAYSEEDAWSVLIEHRGGDLDDYEGDVMAEVAPDEVIRIYVDSDGQPTDDEGEIAALTAREWAQRCGRGFLCSSEY